MRKITISALALLLIISFYLEANSQIIADHWAVQEFEQIPDEWIEKAKELTVHYGHTSHGSQILAGLYWIEENIDPIKYKVSIGNRNGSRTPDLPPLTNPISLRIWEEGLWPDTNSDHLGYWLGDAAVEGTSNILNTGIFDISGWSWCGQVSLKEWSYIQDYLNALSSFEAQFPDVKIFYMTGHNIEPGPPNYQQIAWDRLHANNAGIKNHCIENSGIMFDFADIESHDPDGNYYPDEDGTGLWCEEWLADHPNEYQNLPPRSESGCGAGCGISAHAHGLISAIKAKAFWWMMARIAGWEGVERLSIEEDKRSFYTYKLSQNYPNPFNPSTTIHFSLAKSENVKIEVYNTLGKKVGLLLDGHIKDGEHLVEFNSGDLSSGVYFYSINAGKFQDVKKMIVLK